MFEKLIILVITGMIAITNSGCTQNNAMISLENGEIQMQNGGVINLENRKTYAEEDFVSLKSGTPYDEVIRKYGEADDGWGNLVYPLENGRNLRITISMNEQVLFVEIREGNEFERCLKWEEREKSENDGKSSTRHRKSDFLILKKGMSFNEVENILGLDYTLIGNGFIVAKYLTEDFDWVIISCGVDSVIMSVSVCSIEGEIVEKLIL